LTRFSHQILQQNRHENQYYSIGSIRVDAKSRSELTQVMSMLARRPITLVLMMINLCSYSTNDLVFN